VGVIVAIIILAVGVVVQAEILAVQRLLSCGYTIFVRLVEAVLIVGGEQGQLNVRADRDHHLPEDIIRFEGREAARAVGFDMLAGQHDLAAAQCIDRHALQYGAGEPCVPCTIAGLRFDARIVAGSARKQVHASTEGRNTKVRGIAWSAIHNQRLDRVGREEGVAVMRRIVGVAERHTVIGDIILGVLEAADLRLGFRKSAAIGAAEVGNGGRNESDLVEIGGCGQRVFDEGA